MDGSSTPSPFHEGERAIQERVGAAAEADELGRKMIRPYMPDQHREFYAGLSYLFLGSVDAEGWPWASVLTGAPGFIATPDKYRLRVAARPLADDPLAAALTEGAAIGLLGLELTSRRRNRMNGSVVALTPEGFTIKVTEAFGNCPQNIQRREIDGGATVLDSAAKTERFEGIDEAAKALVARSDTFFVATYAEADHHGGQRTVDASHRGGRAGFVKVEEDGALLIPDFHGNKHFNTLGNILLNGRAGLLFLDFETGDLLQLTGQVEIVWDGPEVAAFKSAERLWRFRAVKGQRLKRALPFGWTFLDHSPNSLLADTWQALAERQAVETARNRYRPYRLIERKAESETITSFYLEPADGGALPDFKAGQHLPIRIETESGEELRRTYTISNAPGEGRLRLSVKREAEGRVSRHLHDRLQPGDSLEAMAPRGGFTLDAAETRPAVLIAGGVGITPMLSMLRHSILEQARTRHQRPIWLIQVARNGRERAFLEEIVEIVQGHPDLHVHFVLTQPEAADKEAKLFHQQGRFAAQHLPQILPFGDYDFYLCGPGGFMQTVYDGLERFGVREERIHAEAFGPSALQRRPDAGAETLPLPPPAEEAKVVFQASGKTALWKQGEGSLLDLAERLGIEAPYSCREGTCGTCATRLVTGGVTYATQPQAAIAEGEGLICCALPQDGEVELVLDL